jgi:probable F420-dependent oxidoreductase
MALALGIVTPGLHVNERFGSPEWEMSASVDDVAWLVREAERSGYDWISCAEHTAIPAAAAEVRGSRYFDPFSTLGYFAASTSSIGLLTHVAVLPYHHPLELVKRLGTLDVLSGGRVIAGVGVGSLQPEFELLGYRFEGRGDRADDAIRAIRAAWGRRTPEYHGTHYDFEGFVVEPSGLARELAIWVGGRTRRSLRRAVELGDAWIPFGLGLDQLGTMLHDPAVRERLARYCDDHGRPLGLVFAPESPIDPLGEPDRTAELLASYIAIGATGFSLRFDQKSPAHCCEQMAALQALVRSTGWSEP